MKLVVLVSVLAVAAASPRLASAATYNLHLGGLCSVNWTDGKGTDALGQWADEVSVDVAIDMRDSITAAAARLEPYLDSHCTGGNTCFIYTYSAGEAVVGYLLANRAKTWNIGFVQVVAGAAGGSRLAGEIAALLRCNLANDLTESHVRGLYNHNDTHGATVYRIGGRKELLETRVACVLGTTLNWLSFGLIGTHCLTGKNDGAVEYHSSAGYSTAGNYSDFWHSGSHWTGHTSYVTLDPNADEGRNLNHYEIKALGVCLEGGIPGKSGLTQCSSFADGTHSQ